MGAGYSFHGNKLALALSPTRRHLQLNSSQGWEKRKRKYILVLFWEQPCVKTRTKDLGVPAKASDRPEGSRFRTESSTSSPTAEQFSLQGNKRLQKSRSDTPSKGIGRQLTQTTQVSRSLQVLGQASLILRNIILYVFPPYSRFYLMPSRVCLPPHNLEDREVFHSTAIEVSIVQEAKSWCGMQQPFGHIQRWLTAALAMAEV